MITKIDACLTKPYAKLNIGFSFKKKKKYWKTPCMSVEVFLYSRGSDSAVFVQAGLPEVCDDLSCELSEIGLQGGFHKVYGRGTFYV